MKVIIAGSRKFNDLWAIGHAVTKSEFIITEVVSGMAVGVDSLGEFWAERNAIPVKQFPADWDGLGKRAGTLRNIQMGDYADALIAIRLDRSSGTTHMIKYMETLGKPVFVIDYESVDPK